MPSPNFQNRTLFHSDNLPILQGMNSETVDLIATDPPFNKGKDFHATPDSAAAGARFQDRWSWERDVHEIWTDAIKDDYPDVWRVIDVARATYGDDMGAFLCFMGVRLIEMRRVLKPTGSIYLHCDPTASHYLRMMMDAVFGRKQFRNEIIWFYKNASRGKKQRAKAHDVILLYAKAGDGVFNREDVLIPYESGMTAWRYKKKGKTPPRGKTPDDVITMPSLNTMDKERVGYPTQKPLALYEELIRSSSNPGDLALDPFAGCATTPIAAEKLERQWVAIDLWEGAYSVVLQRLRHIGLALPDGVSYDPQNPNLLTDRDVHLATEPPARTDEGDAAPGFELRLRVQRAKEAWQKLTHAEIRAILVEAQRLGDAQGGLVVCAGCGIALPARHFELDHVNPRAQGGENWITNRVLICGPCNRRKRHELTLVGLQRENKREKNMENEIAAKDAWDRARIAASRLRDSLS